MRKFDMPAVERYARAHQRRQRWRKIVTFLAAVVVFCTTYILILPAITMEKQCNIPEHTHDSSCYETLTQTGLLCTALRHQHTKDCLDADGSYVCRKADFLLHTHVVACYNAHGDLVCSLPEIAGHIHDASCYESNPEGLQTPVCTQEQIVAHTHTDHCYGKDGCLVCPLPEVLTHQHGDSCFSFQTSQRLICQMQEHTHSDACVGASSDSYVQQFVYEDEQLVLTLNAIGSAPLPGNAQLHVSDVSEMQYQLLQDMISGQNGNGQWIVRDLCLTQDGVPIDTDAYTMTAKIQVKASVFQQLGTAVDDLDDVDLALEVVCWQVDDNVGLKPMDNALFAMDDSAPALTGDVESGTLVLLAGTTENPHYTVQYYANIWRAKASSKGTLLTIFDTRGGKLPQNNDPSSQTTVQIPLVQVSGLNTSKNYGQSTPLYKIDTKEVLTQLYTSESFDYIKAPNTTYVDKLPDSSGYHLSKVWVLTGTDPTSTDPDDWAVYDAADIHFTNRQEFAESNKGNNVIWISSDSVIRLVYAATQNSFSTSAVFYDYDISSGQNASDNWLTGTSGINSPENYGTSANGLTTWNSYRDALAFGNANTGTGMANYLFDGGYLNKRHQSNTLGCTFGLVTRLKDGKIVYNDYLIVPNLFNDGSATGKTTYEDSTLVFKRVGDTYTLSSATAAGLGTISDLEYFFNPSPNSSTVHSHIFTNNFWPMDAATNKTDTVFGGTGTLNRADRKYYGYASSDGITGKWTSESTAFPISDDGNDHNSYFGMQYSVQFNLTADYVGPLDYTFFGDDDMWVFLDDTLICDIGGIHSSVGEYVDLWDYLDQGDAGVHTLTFFYTERGASGSTCYMSFTLPSVTGVNIEQKTSDLTIEKEVVGDSDPNKEFPFQVRFFDQNGDPIMDDYVYDRYSAEGTLLSSDLIICNGATFQLKDGEYVKIKHLPYGLRYTVTELSADGYTVVNTVNGVVQSGSTATGTIIMDVHSRVVFINTTNRVSMTIQKQNPAGAALTGAVFRLKDASGNLLRFLPNADVSYQVLSDVNEFITEGQQYYLALRDSPGYVLGIDGSGNGAGAVLRPIDSDSALALTITRNADGSYCFRYNDGSAEHYLDLDGGGLSNGTAVQFWSGSVPTDNDNQKWFLLLNSDGSLTIKPRNAVLNKSDAVLDLTSSTITDGTKLQIWRSNQTSAQKWILLPVNEGSTVTPVTDLTVNSTGQLNIIGLLPGTYSLSEIQAPSHCVGFTSDVQFHVAADGTLTLIDTGGQTVSVDENNQTLLRVTNDYVSQKLTLTKKVEVATTSQKFRFLIHYTPIGCNEEKTISVELGHNESASISIPYGALVSIEEVEHDGFALSFRNEDTLLDAPDGIYTLTMTADIAITAVNTAGYQLPATGGHGSTLYTAGGFTLLLAALFLLYNHYFRRKEGRSS